MLFLKYFFWPARSIPCLNLPAEPITPVSLTWGTTIFFFENWKHNLMIISVILISVLVLNFNYFISLLIVELKVRHQGYHLKIY